MRQWYLPILKCLFPMLFICYMGSISWFGHAHIVNGVTIIHSHPSSDQSGHQHSANGFQLIHLLSYIIVTGAIIAAFLIVNDPVVLRTCLTKPGFAGDHSLHRSALSLRAPPPFSFC